MLGHMLVDVFWGLAFEMMCGVYGFGVDGDLLY